MNKKRVLLLLLDSLIKIVLVALLVLITGWGLVRISVWKDRKPVVRADETGQLIFRAVDATILGEGGARYNVFRGVENIGWWDHGTQSLAWELTVQETGTYHVTIVYSLPPSDGTECRLTLGDNVLVGAVEGTGGWDVWKTLSLGKVALSDAENLRLVLSATRTSNAGVMNLCEIRLHPCNGGMTE
jgi:hypothetical protein